MFQLGKFFRSLPDREDLSLPLCTYYSSTHNFGQLWSLHALETQNFIGCSPAHCYLCTQDSHGAFAPFQEVAASPYPQAEVAMGTRPCHGPEAGAQVSALYALLPHPAASGCWLCHMAGLTVLLRFLSVLVGIYLLAEGMAACVLRQIAFLVAENEKSKTICPKKIGNQFASLRLHHSPTTRPCHGCPAGAGLHHSPHGQLWS